MALSAASPVPRGDCVHRDERGAERVREGGERERERRRDGESRELYRLEVAAL